MNRLSLMTAATLIALTTLFGCAAHPKSEDVFRKSADLIAILEEEHHEVETSNEPALGLFNGAVGRGRR